MNEKTIIALARIGAGTAILIGSMVTGVDGAMQSLAILLLGLPLEALQSAKTTKEKDESSSSKES